MIHNSHGLRLKPHHPFINKETSLEDNVDIHSGNVIVETFAQRKMIADTDEGRKLIGQLKDLYELLELYRKGYMMK